MKYRLFLFIYLPLNIATAFSTGRDKQEVKDLQAYLKSIAVSNQTLFGQFDTYYSGHDWIIRDTDTGFVKSDVFDICGDYPAIFGFDLNGIKQTSNLKAAIKHHERGGIITISWHMNNLLTGGNAWDCSSDQVVSSILRDDSTKREFCKWLDGFASFCIKMKDKNDNQIPILFRPLHESTSNSFWWGKKCCSDNDFKKLWKFTYNYLVKKKRVNNLIWVFSLDKMRTEKEFNSRYPGNKYVDVIGYEKYHYWTEKESDKECIERFRKEFSDGLDVLTIVSKKHKKIPAVTELGFAGGVPSNFWTYCIEETLKGRQISYLFIWSNSNDNKNNIFGPYSESRDSRDFRNLVNNRRVLLLNGINNKNK